MIGKLYSVWVGSEPSPVLSVYPDDGTALCAFRTLILTIRSDMEDGKLEPGSDAEMALYCHGYYHSDGCVRGLVRPINIMSAVDVQPESEGECEVIQ